MAVVSVKTLHDGWTGTFTSKEMPTFSVVYLVEVDDPQDGNILVKRASGIPRIGSAYAVGQDFHALATCKSISTTPVAGTRNLWQVTASFGKPEKGDDDDDDPTDDVTEDGEPTDDPLKFAVSMSISTTRVTRDAIRGAYLGQVTEVKGVASNLFQAGFNDGNLPPQSQNGVRSDNNGRITNGRPITNSVFSPFDPPPQNEYNRTNLKIKFNTLHTPRKIIPYINSVNSKVIVINVFYRWDNEAGQKRAAQGTFEIPEYAGRVLGISTSPARRNGIGYHENELEIEVDKLYTWRLDILDRGYATLDKDKTFGDSEGKTVPVHAAVVTDDGFASRDPVLLDGKGQALDVDKIDGVYLRYGVYPELDWHIVGLDQPSSLQGDN